MLGFLKRITSVYYANNSFSIISDHCIRNNFLQLRTIRVSVSCKSDLEENEEKKKKKKQQRIPEITLMQTDGSVTVTILENAMKIAKRHNLHLIKMPQWDTKGSREIYRLVDHATYIKETEMLEKNEIGENAKDTESTSQTAKKNKYKSTKLFMIASNIDQHDLNIKLNNINKLLNKKHKIKIMVTHSEKKKNKEETIGHIRGNVQGVVSAEKMTQNSTTITYIPLEGENSNEIKSDTGKV